MSTFSVKAVRRPKLRAAKVPDLTCTASSRPSPGEREASAFHRLHQPRRRRRIVVESMQARRPPDMRKSRLHCSQSGRRRPVRVPPGRPRVGSRPGKTTEGAPRSSRRKANHPRAPTHEGASAVHVNGRRGSTAKSRLRGPRIKPELDVPDEEPRGSGLPRHRANQRSPSIPTRPSRPTGPHANHPF